ICAELHACRPSAAEGFTPRPGGRATTAFLSAGTARPLGSSFCGTCRSTDSPVGVSAADESGWMFSEGLNDSFSQPVGPVGVVLATFTQVPGLCHGAVLRA